MNKEECLAYLKGKNVEMEVIEHLAVFTMEEMHDLHLEKEDAIAKNLFLRDDKKKNYYLLAVHTDQRVDLKELRILLQSRPLSFASENDLNRFLQIQKGSVTPLGALNDENHKVKVFVDDRFQGQTIGIHPLENTATVFMKADDLVNLLKEKGEKCEFLSLR